jgi:hypothetical protein
MGKEEKDGHTLFSIAQFAPALINTLDTATFPFKQE